MEDRSPLPGPMAGADSTVVSAPALAGDEPVYGHRNRAVGAIRDVVVGMSDGLTVPFALAAGISGAVASTGIVVAAGMAEIAAGSIAMGLGGYLATRSETEFYSSKLAGERAEVDRDPDEAEEEVRGLLAPYQVPSGDSDTILRVMRRNPRLWADFMMKFELGLEPEDRGRGLRSAFTIGGAYIAGGLIPLTPYVLMHSIEEGLFVSIACTLSALFVFGYVKGRFTGARPIVSALQTVMVGAIAAAAAFVLAKAIA